MISSADRREVLIRRIADIDSRILQFQKERQDTRPVEAARHYLQAQLANQAGDLEASRTHYGEAVSGFKQAGMGAEWATVATEGARVMQEAGQLGPALELACAAIDGAELVWLGMSQADRLHAPRELVGAADAAIPIAFAAGEAFRMFDILQRCKARWFNEQLMMCEAERLLPALAGQKEPNPALTGAIAALDEAWNRYFANEPADAIAPAESALVQAYGVEIARKQVFRSLVAATSSIDSCRAALKSGEGLLEFFVGTNDSFALLLTVDTLKIEPLGIGARELQDRVLPLMGAVQTAPDRRGIGQSIQQSNDPERLKALQAADKIRYPAPTERLSELGVLLLGKLEGALAPIRRLIVCPHWVLHSIPFHALGTRLGETLAATTAVTYAPSASSWERLRRLSAASMPAKPPHVAVLGVERRPKPKSNWFSSALTRTAPLEPASMFEAEGQAVAALSGALPLLGDAATKQAFAQALEQADIVHVSCHNALGRSTALTDGLLLADGIVTVAELSVVPRPKRSGPQLVVLSACRSGLERVEPGDLRISSGDALAARYGCRVLSSLWSVDAEATAMLMGRLHAHFSDAGDWAEALRRAQIETLSSSSRTVADGGSPAVDFSDPYYWSGFFVLGS